MKRVDKQTNACKFVTSFYISPVGVGRSRFMGASLSKVSLPRWAMKLALDNFLDQDTYLLATQQHHILSREAKDLRDMMKERETQKQEDAASNGKGLPPLELQPMSTRRKLFCLSSPTDAFGAKLEQFWDATLLRSPNRIPNLLRLDSAGAFLETPSRAVVLDRKIQHLDICPDSQDALKFFRRVEQAGLVVSIAALATKLLFMTGSNKIAFLKPSFMAWTVGISLFISLLARRVCQEYYFKYTEDYRRKDMQKIPKNIWLDN
jgi:hypothetical protein